MAAARTVPSTAFVPARYYDVLATLLEERGHTRVALLADTGIERARLSHEEGLLNIAEVERLVQRACQLDPSEPLALSVGMRLNLPSHGATGLAGMTAATFGAAIATAQRYFALVMPLFTLDYTLDPQFARIGLRAAFPLSPRAERFHVEVTLGSLYSQGKFFLGGHVPSGVELDLRYGPRASPAGWSPLPDLHVRFDQPVHELRIPALSTAQPSPLADAKAHRAACKSCDALLAALPLPDRVSGEVRRTLERAGPPFPDFEAVAHKLGTSSRNLRRRLSAEGTSFRGLLDEVRNTLAERWLGAGERSITEIAFELGYSDAANFTRAFRRTRGLSPLAFQRRLGTARS
jgi:AraC-like DNA-binding protein